MILRIAVVIPYFDNPRTISQVVNEVVIKTPFPVLIIDDGSERPVANVLYSFEVKQALENGRVRLVRFDKKQGKGAAVQYAIHDLVAQGFTHMLTLDGDGLSLPQEIAKFVNCARQHPFDLILGDRQLVPVPGNRLKRFFSRLLSYCVRFETGTRVHDTASSFRLYPLFPLQMMKFRSKSFDFDLEVLIRLMWNRVHVREIPIQTAVFDPNEHVTHFHRFWDSLKISCLNLVLLSLSLLRSHNRPLELAIAVGLGVFVGCTPVFGFHTLIVLALAVVLRLNFIALWLGTHVSTPILFPLLLFSEVYIGQHWLHLPTGQGMMGHVYQWAGGSIVLGVLLSVPLAILTYFLARSLQFNESSEALPVESTQIKQSLKWLGLRNTLRLSGLLATVRYVFCGSARRALSEYYQVLDPNLSMTARQVLIWRHLDQIIKIETEHLAQVEKKDGESKSQNHLVVGAHLGRPLSFKGQTYYNLDQIMSSQVEVIPFLGKLGLFDVSAFHLSVQSHAPIVECFTVRLKSGDYEDVCKPARDFSLRGESSLDLQVYDRASRFVLQLEFQVRKHPDQWFNLFPFFSRVASLAERAPAQILEEHQALKIVITRSDHAH